MVLLPQSNLNAPLPNQPRPPWYLPVPSLCPCWTVSSPRAEMVATFPTLYRAWSGVSTQEIMSEKQAWAKAFPDLGTEARVSSQTFPLPQVGGSRGPDFNAELHLLPGVWLWEAPSSTRNSRGRQQCGANEIRQPRCVLRTRYVPWDTQGTLAVSLNPYPQPLVQQSLTPASTENIALLTAFANTRGMQRGPEDTGHSGGWALEDPHE